jgi:hypothetical protein
MKDTMGMARESWIDVYGLGHDRAKFIEALKHFEFLVRADEREEANCRANASWTLMCEKMVAIEREACAKLCETLVMGKHCAAAIRNRGNT